MGDDKGKILIAGSLMLTVLVGVIFFLFVFPAMMGSNPTMAQPPAGPSPTGPGVPPGPSGVPAGPGGPPTMPGGAGSPPGMGGGPGGASASAPAAPAAAPVVKVPPLEKSRPNPFSLPELGAFGPKVSIPYVTSYGTNWNRLPITMRLGFVRPQIPSRAAVVPPPPKQLPAEGLTVTSIMWTQNGQALAVYQMGKKSGVVKPGDIVDNWQVMEIWRDHIVVADRKTGAERSVYLSTKKAAPAARRAPQRRYQRRGRPGRRPGRGAPGAPPVF